MTMLARPMLVACLLISMVGVILTAAVFAEALPGRSASALPNLTLSFDATPAYSEFWTIQPGYTCANGSVKLSSPTKPPSAAFGRDNSRGNVRHGRYSARIVLNPGDHASYTCKAEAVEAIRRLNEGEGSSSWWGWSWKLPVGWRGTNSWGELFEFTTRSRLLALVRDAQLRRRHEKQPATRSPHRA